MATPINRESLSTDMETRYKNQNAGGAFDAKNIVTQPGDRSSNGGVGFGLQETRYTNKLFRVSSNSFLQQSDFKNEGNNLSLYSKGLNTTPYKK